MGAKDRGSLNEEEGEARRCRGLKGVAKVPAWAPDKGGFCAVQRSFANGKRSQAKAGGGHRRWSGMLEVG